MARKRQPAPPSGSPPIVAGPGYADPGTVTPQTGRPAGASSATHLPLVASPPAGFQIFNLGFPSTVADEILEARDQTNICVEDFRGQITAYLRRCLVTGQITDARCRACVQDAYDLVRRNATNCAERLSLPVAQTLANLMSMAAEIASSIGCRLGSDPPGSFPTPPTAPRPAPFPGEPPWLPPGQMPPGGPGTPVGPPGDVVRPPWRDPPGQAPGWRLPPGAPDPGPGWEPGLQPGAGCGWQVARLWSPTLDGGRGMWGNITVYRDQDGVTWVNDTACLPRGAWDCSVIPNMRLHPPGSTRAGNPDGPVGSAGCRDAPPPPPPPPPTDPPGPPIDCPPVPPPCPDPPPPPRCPPKTDPGPGPDPLAEFCKTLGDHLNWNDPAICTRLDAIQTVTAAGWGSTLADWLCGIAASDPASDPPGCLPGQTPPPGPMPPGGFPPGRPPVGPIPPEPPSVDPPWPEPPKGSPPWPVGPGLPTPIVSGLILPGNPAFSMPSASTVANPFPVDGPNLFDGIPGMLSKLLCIPVKLIGKAVDWLQQTASKCGPCTSPVAVNLHLVRGLIGVAEKYIGDNFNEIQQPLNYWGRYLCQYLLPSAADANAAWLGGEINDDLWKCWIKANGMYPAPWQCIRDSQRSKLSPIDITALWRRGEIGDQEYDTRIRELGYIKGFETAEFMKLSEFVPPIQDLLRFMVRDVEDMRIVNRFGMSDQFGQKWAGRSKEWGQWQGIADEVAERYWRAHWAIPSPTQLWEWLRRQRHNPRWGGVAQVEQDVRDALVQQDILPFWIDRLMELSYNPLTRTDASRAYSISVIDFNGLVASYQALGYDDTNANTLARFRDKEGRLGARNHKWAKLYEAGGINEADARAMLAFDGVRPEWVDEVITAKQREISAKRRIKCVASSKRKFMRGEIDAQAATNEIINQGLDTEFANIQVSTWGCEIAAAGRYTTMLKNCQFLEIGLIDGPEFLRRAMNLHYSNVDALHLLAQCSDRISKKVAKEAERQAKEAEKELRRQQKEAEAAGRRRAADAEKMRKLHEQSEKARERREDQLLEAAEKYAKVCAMSLGDAAREMRAAVRTLKAQTTNDVDDIIQYVVLASEAATCDPSFDLTAAALERAAAEADLASSIAEAGDSPPPNTNGET